MKELQGRTALVTGSSGGIGVHIAEALARQGMNVVVSGRREDALAEVVGQLRALGVKAESVPADLSDLGQIDYLIEGAEKAIGPLDVLVNNAGVESNGAFPRYSRAELTQMVDVNLTAPMLLTHAVLPGMLERGRGHVVFISSVAGKAGAAYNEPYSATKAGLIGLSQSLRAEYHDSPVGFSVVCPGFTAGDGMYQRMVEGGIKSNWMIGETTVEKVARAVVTSIVKDHPEIISSGSPMRPLLALGQLSPRFQENAIRRSGSTEIFRRASEARDRL